MSQTETGTQSGRIGLDDQFSCLSDGTRRRILVALANRPAGADREFDVAEFQPDDAETRKFETKAHHKHLPRLSDAGLVDWDRDAGTVERGPRFERVEPLLTLLDQHQDQFPGDWPSV